jgi:hypothetical protein
MPFTRLGNGVLQFNISDTKDVEEDMPEDIQDVIIDYVNDKLSLSSWYDGTIKMDYQVSENGFIKFTIILDWFSTNRIVGPK